MEADNTNTRPKRSLSANRIVPASEIGKIPPHSIDVEEAVLGAMLLGQQAVNDAIDILSSDSFYKTEHQKIFGAILHLFGNSETIDILSVTERLRKNGDIDIVGGPAAVAKLTNRVASTAHVE
jgi:replicative DNA helicase